MAIKWKGKIKKKRSKLHEEEQNKYEWTGHLTGRLEEN